MSGCCALGSQLGPQLVLTSLHLVAPGGDGVAHPPARAARRLAGRPADFDDEGVGLSLAAACCTVRRTLRSAHSDEPAPRATPVTNQKVRLGMASGDRSRCASSRSASRARCRGQDPTPT